MLLLKVDDYMCFFMRGNSYGLVWEHSKGNAPPLFPQELGYTNRDCGSSWSFNGRHDINEPVSVIMGKKDFIGWWSTINRQTSEYQTIKYIIKLLAKGGV